MIETGEDMEKTLVTARLEDLEAYSAGAIARTGSN
jgi:hypothetical protein